MNMNCQRSKQELCFARANQVSLLANEFDVGSALQGLVSLAAVNHILCDS